MTTGEMIAQINLMMGESYSAELLSAYISQAQQECYRYEYQLVGEPVLEDGESPDYSKYDSVVIFSVIQGMSIRGAEGETQHSENGILRGFKYSDMNDYIHAHIIPYANLR